MMFGTECGQGSVSGGVITREWVRHLCDFGVTPHLHLNGGGRGRRGLRNFPSELPGIDFASGRSGISL